MRYIAQDDPKQFARALAFIETELSAEAPGFVSAVVLVETVWVLSRAFDANRSEIGKVVAGLLGAGSPVLEHSSAVARALTRYGASRDDFPDCLIAAIAAEAGCTETVTFDRKFAKQEGVRLLA